MAIPLEEAMPIFYKRLFPFREMYDWLSYGNTGDQGDATAKDFFLRREWSMTLHDPVKGEIYLRYKSYPDQDLLARDIQGNKPVKIDIGAVYNAPPRDKAQLGGAFAPVERELVFDIDMDDYNDVRTCCKEKWQVCNKCWVLMVCAIKVMHAVLTVDFGFEHVLWVYSGRRGVHCWVCDKRARTMAQDARAAVAGYMSVIAMAHGKSRKTELPPVLHPHLQRAYDEVLLPLFEERLVQEQAILGTPSRQRAVLALLPPEMADVKARVASQWALDLDGPIWGAPTEASGPTAAAEIAAESDDGESQSRWEYLRGELEAEAQRGLRPSFDALTEIVFAYTYPRLDVAVSLGMNHLLKSPWCVHPGTGRVCVALDPATCEEFDPVEDAPTAAKCVAQINDYDTKHGVAAPGARGSLPDYKKTDMKPYMKYFKEQFLKPLHQSISLELQQQRQSAAAAAAAAATAASPTTTGAAAAGAAGDLDM